MPSASSAPTLPFLERLLDGEKVEWKTLGEVFHTRNGYTPSKANEEFWTDGTIPWFRMEDIRANGRILYDSALHITPQAVKRNGLFKANSIILATSATIGEHALLLQDALTNQRFTNFEIKEELKNILLPKFAFYYFFIIDEWCKKHTIIGNFPSVDTQQLMELPFPIPPLRVQARIVDILDKFTQLETELEAELEARNKQYDFYRNRLLDFALRDDLKGQVEWKTLGEVAELVRGNGLSKKDFSEFGVPAIHYGQIYTYYGNETEETLSFVSPETAKKLQKVYPGNIVITNTSENVEDVCKAVLYSGNVEAVTGGHASIIRTKDCILPKYLVYYTLTLDFFTQKKRLAKGTKVIDVSAKDLAKIIIPLPPLSEQRRIAEILDRFDTLTNSISEGLPREIALRRKQYEYYRDALLRFPPPAPTA